MATKKFHYGGQAVIEGVMIRGRKNMVTVVRKPDGDMAIDKQPLSTLYTGWMRSTPLIRGVIVLIESLVFGIQTLNYSANVAMGEENKKESSCVGMGGVGIFHGFRGGALFPVAALFNKMDRYSDVIDIV